MVSLTETAICSEALKFDIFAFLSNFSDDIELDGLTLNGLLQLAVKQSDNNVRLAILSHLEMLLGRRGASISGHIPDILNVFLKYVFSLNIPIYAL
jgi:hypothetical protein